MCFQLLWSFCYSELKEADMRPFRLTHAIPGAPNSLDYNSSSTFGQSDLANSMISVTWEWRWVCYFTVSEFLKTCTIEDFCFDCRSFVSHIFVACIRRNKCLYGTKYDKHIIYSVYIHTRVWKQRDIYIVKFNVLSYVVSVFWLCKNLMLSNVKINK